MSRVIIGYSLQVFQHIMFVTTFNFYEITLQTYELNLFALYHFKNIALTQRYLNSILMTVVFSSIT